MRTLTTKGNALIDGKELALVYLIRVETYEAPVLLNTGGWDLIYDSEEYLSVGQFVSIEEITDTSSELPGLNFSIAISDAGLSLALADSALMKGKQVILRTALIDINDFGIVDAPIEWAGKVDNFKINTSSESATITISCETYALDLIRIHSFRYTNTDQQKLDPTDLGFEFVKDADTPIVWPSAAYLRRQ